MPIQDLRDEYKIVGEIGAGGMATVYKAIQKSLDRPVAIKELKKAYHGDTQTVQRFERESRVAASLQHENIAHIYDYWKKPAYCIVMEYVDGVNLADIIEKTGALPVDVGVMIALQICSALEYAHMRGLVHRDIKPSNIMVKRNGEVKLMDFGIAHTRNLESLTLPGTMIGTPAYMAPEQILGQQLDVRSDMFSFGIVLYEMFTGTKPFSDEETRAVSAKILKDKFIPPRRMNKDIPWSLQRIIKKCLKKKPQKRYGSMLELERKLGKRIAGKTTKASSLQRIAEYLVAMNVTDAAPDRDAVVVANGKPKRGLLKKVIIVGIITMLLAIAGGLYYYYTYYQPQPVPPPSKPGPAQPAMSMTAPVVATKPQATIPTALGTAPTSTPPAGVKPVPGAPVSAPTISAVSGDQKKDEPAQKTSTKKKKKKKKKTPPPES